MFLRVEIELFCFKVLEQLKLMIKNKLLNMVALNIEKELMTLEKENSCKLVLNIGELFINNLSLISIPMVLMETALLISGPMLPPIKIIIDKEPTKGLMETKV